MPGAGLALSSSNARERPLTARRPAPIDVETSSDSRVWHTGSGPRAARPSIGGADSRTAPAVGTVTAETPLSAIAAIDGAARHDFRAGWRDDGRDDGRDAVRLKASACRSSRRAAARPRAWPSDTLTGGRVRRLARPAAPRPPPPALAARPGRPRAAPVPRRRLRPVAAVAWRTHRPPPSPAQLCVRLDAGCRVPAGSRTGWRPRARPPPYGPRREPGAGGPRRVALAELQGGGGDGLEGDRLGLNADRGWRGRRPGPPPRKVAPRSRSPGGEGHAATTPAPPAVLRWQTRRPPRDSQVRRTASVPGTPGYPTQRGCAPRQPPRPRPSLEFGARQAGPPNDRFQRARPQLAVVRHRDGHGPYFARLLHHHMAPASSHLAEAVSRENPTDVTARKNTQPTQPPPRPASRRFRRAGGLRFLPQRLSRKTA